MDNNDKKRFSQIMVGLSENFSSKVTDQGLELRFNALQEYNINQIFDASMVILKTRKYTTMPTVADFVEALDGNPLESVQIQADIVRNAINNIGSYQNPKFEDPITQYIFYNNIGLQRIRGIYTKDIPFVINEFKESYLALSKAKNNKMIAVPEGFRGIIGNIGRIEE